MKDNRNDRTIAEYELVKAKSAPKFRFVQDFHPFHGVSRQTFAKYYNRRYLVSVVDARARLAWAEVADDLKRLSVMFAALKSLNLLNAEYGIRFEAVLTDNGAEAASRGNLAGHPVERLLGELGIKHRRRGPYRPQTNGKAERFWRTLNEELLEGTTFEMAEELREELGLYLLYYNTARPHQGLGARRPSRPCRICQRITDIYNSRVGGNQMRASAEFPSPYKGRGRRKRGGRGYRPPPNAARRIQSAAQAK